MKRKEVVDTQSRKVTDKIVASVFTKNSDMLMVYILNILLLGIFDSVNNYMGMITVGLSTA